MVRYNATHCRPYVGQMVHVHTVSGMHRGVVESVTSRGMYLRPVVQQVVGDLTTDFVHAAKPHQSLDAETVYYYGGYGGYGGGYGWGYGRFFIPFLTILALTSLLWW